MSKQSNNTFDRDLEPIRLRRPRFPSVFNVIVPVTFQAIQITRPNWLQELEAPEGDVYYGLPYTLSIPGGVRCLWRPRGDGICEMITPGGGLFEMSVLPDSVRPAEVS